MAAVKYRYFWSESNKVKDIIQNIRSGRTQCFNASSKLAHDIGAKQAVIRGHHIIGFIFDKQNPRRPHWIPKGKAEGNTIYTPSSRYALGKNINKAMSKITLPVYEDAISHFPFKRLVITEMNEVFNTEIAFIQEKDLSVARVMIAAPEGAVDDSVMKLAFEWEEWSQQEATQYQYEKRAQVC